MKENKIDSHVGTRLRDRRTMLGYSQKAVAKAIGVTFQQVQKYEKGTNAMSASRLVEFSRFMNVSVAYFFEGLDNKAESKSPNQGVGFAEDTKEPFAHGNQVSDREALEMMKAFKRIKEQLVRKRLSDLVRAIAENKAIME